MGGEKKKKTTTALGLKGWAWRLGLSGVGGAGVFLAFPTWDIAPLAWFCLAFTLYAAHGTTGRQHFLIGLWSGTVTNTGGFWWIGGMLMDFGHMSFLPAAFFTVLMAVYQGLVFALGLLLVHWLKKRSRAGYWLLAPVAYVAAEIVVPFIFPWYYANSQYWVIPFIQICELGGVTLLSFLLIMVNGFLTDALLLWRAGEAGVFKRLAGAVLVPLLIGGYGLLRISMVDDAAAEAPKLAIGLVEADVGIWEKEDPQKIEDNLVRHQRMSMQLEKKGADLIVWPETSYHAPFTYVVRRGEEELKRFRLIPRDAARIAQSDSAPPEHASQDRAAGMPLRERVAPQRGFSAPLLFGALSFMPNPENESPRHPGVDLFNTAILLDEKGKVLGAYDKVYLLIFGEYIPLGHAFPVLYEWLPEAGDLEAGESVEVIEFGRYRIGVMVCYEDILPEFTRRIADKQPNILINVTNDAWFGKTSEPYLHMALAVFRAVETRVPLVRSTNTGVSCFVDPAGRIVSETGLEEAETLLEEMPMMEGGTPYQHLGDWPAYLCLLALPLFWWRGRSGTGHSRKT